MSRSPDGDELLAAVDRLCRSVSHWTPARWAAPSPRGGSRAHAVAAVVQRLADLAAEAEGEPRRLVPRLDNDLTLSDQLRVMATDLVTARPAPEVISAAAEMVDDVRRGL